MIPVESTISILAQASEEWLDPKCPWRAEAVTALSVSTGQSGELVERALANAMGELQYTHLQQFVASEVRPYVGVGMGRTVLHILPGNVFTAWLPAAVTSLLMGFRCWLKPSRREQVFPALWRRSLSRIDPAFESALEIVEWPIPSFAPVSAVVGFGSDASLDTIAVSVPPGVKLVRYGSKLSVAVLYKEALAQNRLQETTDRLLADASLFDLQGCLSPQVVFVEGKADRLAGSVGTKLHPALKLQSFSSDAELIGLIHPFEKALSCIGIAGNPERIVELQHSLSNPSVRFCGLGEMQRPPLSWRNGGLSLPEALASSVDVIAKTPSKA
jgi:hypothetical protein